MIIINEALSMKCWENFVWGKFKNIKIEVLWQLDSFKKLVGGCKRSFMNCLQLSLWGLSAQRLLQLQINY
jgi:hypothetical protein